MSGWDVVTNAVDVQSLVGVAVFGVMMKAYSTYAVTLSPESLLEVCKTDLEVVEWRLKQLTPGQRDESHVLTEQKKSKSLETIELEMHR